MPYIPDMRSERLELRLAEADRSLLNRATSVSGESVSEFVRAAVRERATEILRDDPTIAIPAADAEAFLRALDDIDDATVAGLRELRQRAARVFPE